jgi:hypothetical protein
MTGSSNEPAGKRMKLYLKAGKPPEDRNMDLGNWLAVAEQRCQRSRKLKRTLENEREMSWRRWEWGQETEDIRMFEVKAPWYYMMMDMSRPGPEELRTMEKHLEDMMGLNNPGRRAGMLMVLIVMDPRRIMVYCLMVDVSRPTTEFWRKMKMLKDRPMMNRRWRIERRKSWKDISAWPVCQRGGLGWKERETVLQSGGEGKDWERGMI